MKRNTLIILFLAIICSFTACAHNPLNKKQIEKVLYKYDWLYINPDGDGGEMFRFRKESEQVLLDRYIYDFYDAKIILDLNNLNVELSDQGVYCPYLWKSEMNIVKWDKDEYFLVDPDNPNLNSGYKSNIPGVGYYQKQNEVIPVDFQPGDEITLSDYLRLWDKPDYNLSVDRSIPEGFNVKILEIGKSQVSGEVESVWVKVELLSDVHTDYENIEKGTIGWTLSVDFYR